MADTDADTDTDTDTDRDTDTDTDIHTTDTDTDTRNFGINTRIHSCMQNTPRACTHTHTHTHTAKLLQEELVHLVGGVDVKRIASGKTVVDLERKVCYKTATKKGKG